MTKETGIDDCLLKMEKIGFPKDGIELELRRQIALGIPRFQVVQIIPFGENTMNFKLLFEQDFKEKIVGLKEISAFCQNPVPIDNLVINGISTHDLDEQMKAIDWKAYFSGELQDSGKEDASGVLNHLWKLPFEDNNGIAVQNKLIYKYLPEPLWNEEAKRLSYLYQSFPQIYTDFHGFNTRLCYAELSGKLPALKEILEKLDPTVLLASGMFSGGVAQLFRVKQNLGGIIHLGYPVYVLSILGVWKILGVISIIVPQQKLLKEWAYAGFFFAMTGAVVSHIARGDRLPQFIAPLIFILLTVTSWYFRPANRKLIV